MKLEKNPSEKNLKEVKLICSNFLVEFHSTRNQMDKNKWAQFIDECQYSEKVLLQKLNVLQARKHKSKSPAKTPIGKKLMHMVGKLGKKSPKNKKVKVYQ